MLSPASSGVATNTASTPSAAAALNHGFGQPANPDQAPDAFHGHEAAALTVQASPAGPNSSISPATTTCLAAGTETQGVDHGFQGLRIRIVAIIDDGCAAQLEDFSALFRPRASELRLSTAVSSGKSPFQRHGNGGQAVQNIVFAHQARWKRVPCARRHHVKARPQQPSRSMFSARTSASLRIP